MQMKTAKQTIDEQCEKFLKFIQKCSDSNLKSPFQDNGFTFSIFDNDATFCEQKIFEELIENSIWRYLVNGILRVMFSEKELSVEWTEIHPQLAASFVEKIERRYHVEFVIHGKEETIGYRYTDCYYSEDRLGSIFAFSKIDKLVIIDFSSLQNRKNSVQHIPPSYKEKISKISFEKFFVYFFGEKYYTLYFDATTYAIKSARHYVGLKTIRNLTEQYHPLFVN